MFVAASWDSKVRLWDVQVPSLQTAPRMLFQHERPVLCTAWTSDGARVVSGGCDNIAKMWDISTGQGTQIAAHQAPIKEIAFLDGFNLVVTGSWDKTLKYWDARSPNPVGTVTLPERVYAMDAAAPLLVVGTAERHILVYDLKNPTVAYKTTQSPLKYQTRTIAAFPDLTGFAVGSIEGRCAIHFIEDRDAQKNFAFKCHRDNDDIYAVNGVGFHQTWGTFFTVGSDGTANFWDKDSKQRLKPFPRGTMSVTAAAFNYDSNNIIFAYAVGYDWSKGAEYFNPQAKPHIMLHPTPESEIKPKSGKKVPGR